MGRSFPRVLAVSEFELSVTVTSTVTSEPVLLDKSNSSKIEVLLAGVVYTVVAELSDTEFAKAFLKSAIF
jgi:hypothetical protein